MELTEIKILCLKLFDISNMLPRQDEPVVFPCWTYVVDDLDTSIHLRNIQLAILIW